MLTKMLMTTAAGVLMMSSAMAQSNMDAPKTTPNTMTAPSRADSPTMNRAATGSVQTITTQGPNQWLASSIKGTNVVGPDDVKIGDVNDILLTQDGRVDAYIVGVGGFLGIGTKNIALAPSSFQTVRDKDTVKLKVAMTKDQLKEHAAFETKANANTAATPATSTTGSAPREPAPATGGMNR